MATHKRRLAQTLRGYTRQLLDAESSLIELKSRSPVEIALVYPNSYEVGMANLGVHTLYHLFNAHDEVRCERAFCWGGAFEGVAKTLESNRSIGEFDIIAFSISFELDYLRVLELLHRGGIPLLAEERGRHDPLVIAGGAAVTINPSPLMPVMDALFIGEIEQQLPQMIEVFRRAGELDGGRASLLELMGGVEGVLVPATVQSRGPSAARQYVAELRAHPTFSRVVTPHSHYRNTFLIEIGRGCSRGCSFCAAGHIYRPLRMRSVEEIIGTVRENIAATNKVGLVSSALSDFPDLDLLCAQLVQMGYKLGLSSFRLEVLTRELLEQLYLADVHTVAIAPEAGSERLRFLINKGIRDEEILRSLVLLGDSRIRNLRLYFMIGLPGESDSDLEAIIQLVRTASRHFIGVKRGRSIKVSINTMIPKPWTVFQWAAMISRGEINRRRALLHRGLQKIRGVIVVPKSTRGEIFQGIFSLGGENIGRALAVKVRTECSWEEAWEAAGVEWRALIERVKDGDEVFPWDIIDAGIDRARLWRTWRRAVREGA